MNEVLAVLSELLGKSANIGDLIGLSSLGFMLVVTIPNLLSSKAKKPEKKAIADKKTPSPSATPSIGWRDRLFSGLEKSRHQVWDKVAQLIHGSPDESVYEEIEEILYSADISPKIAMELIESLKKERNLEPQEFKSFVVNFLEQKMAPAQEKLDQDLFEFKGSTSAPKVYMIVGVNGAGKTTTIGKLATKLTKQGAKVVVGACDTFRAAAVEQLEVWCERAGAHIIKAAPGADPSGVAFDAVKYAVENKADYCLVDTAGRLHTKTNLMDELKKTQKVMSKVQESAPEETLLVIDAITGQNALRQAEEFNNTLNLSGLIFTKCDGSSKAGSAVGIVEHLSLPIAYIGVGEKVEDLDRFKLSEYLEALVGAK